MDTKPFKLRVILTASVRESVPTSNPESGKRWNEAKVRNGQSLTSAHRNACHCGHRPRSPASVLTTATGPLPPSAVPRSSEVTLNLTRVPQSSFMRSGATSHIQTSFRTLSIRALSMPKPRDSVVSRGAQPHPETPSTCHPRRPTWKGPNRYPGPPLPNNAVLMTLAGIERTLVQGGISWPGAGWVAPFEQASQAIPTKGPPIGFRFRLASQTAKNPSPDRADCSVVFDGRCRDYGM